MAQGDPYARIVNMMRRRGEAANGFDMVKAKIIGIDPIAIAINGQTITDHIIYNGILTSDKDEELAEILEAEENISDRLKLFLTELYKSLRVQPGDYVLVQRVKNSFYICEKVELL